MKTVLIRIAQEGRNDLSEYFLLRAVKRINRFIKSKKVIVQSRNELQERYLEILAQLSVPFELNNEFCFDRELPLITGENAGFAEINGNDLNIHNLTVPKEFGIIDCHVHTPLAYCQENLDVSLICRMAEASGLSRFIFSEHSGHLYLCKDDYNHSSYYNSGLETCRVQSRMADYKSLLISSEAEGFLRGMELDCDSCGSPVAFGKDLDGIDIKLGAIHHLNNRQPEKAYIEFMDICEKLISSGIDVLAHPFRIFQRMKMGKPVHMYEAIAELLAEYGVAAEINFHTNNPEGDFFGCCIEKGVKVALGSDSHNLYEVGDLIPHLDFLDTVRSSKPAVDLLWTP